MQMFPDMRNMLRGSSRRQRLKDLVRPRNDCATGSGDTLIQTASPPVCVATRGPVALTWRPSDWRRRNGYKTDEQGQIVGVSGKPNQSALLKVYYRDYNPQTGRYIENYPTGQLALLNLSRRSLLDSIGKPRLGYCVIVDVQACGSTLSNEREAARIMIDRVEATFDIKPDRLVGDTAYGSGSMLGWIVNEKQIAPHIPVWEKSEREDGTLSSNDFRWDQKTDEYRCPQGHALRSQWRSFKTPRTHVTQDGTIKYRASQFDCATCPIKARCCPNTPVRTITRSVHEAARDVARAIAKTDAYKQSRHDRKKVEMLFAHLKRILKFDRLRLRGPKSAQDEFLLAATAQNLRRLAIWFAQAPPKLQSVTV